MDLLADVIVRTADRRPRHRPFLATMSTIESSLDTTPAMPGQLPPLEVCGQQLTVFTTPLTLMEALLADVRTARTRIWIEDYIVLDDWIGQRIADALVERVAAGVDVRFLYDSIGSLESGRSYFDRLRDGGVQVHAFHPPLRLLLALNWKRANLRDHRRLFIIDDAVGYFGGMNIGDFGGTGSQRPRSSHRSAPEATWPDVHVRLAGTRQSELAAAFAALWESVHLRKPVQSPLWELDRMERASTEAICFFASDSRDPQRCPEQVFVPLIRQARHSITLLMSYFLPQGDVLEELLAAPRRGVRVRVVVPGDSDVKLVQYATRHLYEELLGSGVELFERAGQMLHSKAMVIDGDWSVVGSCNLDPRSLWINLELFAAIRSRGFAEHLERLAADHIARSRQVTLEQSRGRRWWQRLLDGFCWSIRRWL